MTDGETVTTPPTPHETGAPTTTATIGNPAQAAVLNNLRPTLEWVYVSSWNVFLAQIEANERSARMKRLAKEQRLEKKADDVTQLLNAEGNVDPKCLAELIRKEVANQRASDQQKIKSLETKVRNQNIGNNNNSKNKNKNQNNKGNNNNNNEQKNNERGRGGAARPKKSTTRSHTPPTRRGRSKGRHSADRRPKGILRNSRYRHEADDHDNGSHGDNRNKSRRRSSSRSSRRNGKSKTRRGKSNDRSKRK